MTAAKTDVCNFVKNPFPHPTPLQTKTVFYNHKQAIIPEIYPISLYKQRTNSNFAKPSSKPQNTVFPFSYLMIQFYYKGFLSIAVPSQRCQAQVLINCTSYSGHL